MTRYFTNHIKDLIYGANDGIITSFAVIAGVAGANLPTHTVTILGLASLFADSIAMGTSNYLGTQSEQDTRSAQRLRSFGSNPIIAALSTIIAFIVAGAIPLIPFLLNASNSFGQAILATALALFGIGALRTSVTKQPWLRSGFQMLMIGGLAAGVAYAVGTILRPSV